MVTRVHGSRTSFPQFAEAKSMNAIAATNSSGVSSVPAAGSAQFLGQSAGFALALAAAKGETNSPQSLGRGTSGSGTESVNAAPFAPKNGTVVSTVAPSPAKKLLNNAPAGVANLIPAVNMVVPTVPALPPSAIASLALPMIAGVAPQATGGSSVQSGITASANATDQKTRAVSGPSLNLPASGDAPSSAIFAASSSLVSRQAIAFQNAATGHNLTATTPAESAEAGVVAGADLIPNASADTASSADASVPTADPQAPVPVPESDAQQLPHGASSPAPSVTQLDPAAGESAPVLLASANSAPANLAGENPAGPLGGANSQGYLVLPSAPAAPGAAMQWSPAQTAINSSIPPAPLPVPTGQLSTSPAAIVKPAIPFAVVRANGAAVNSPGKAATQSGGTGGSGASSASPSSSLEAPGSAAANDPGQQTPFGVFFSTSGPGTESAAAVLPKMILPPTGTAVQGNQASAVTAAGAKSNSALGTSLQPATNAKSTTAAQATTLTSTSIQQSLAVTAANAQPNAAQTLGGQAPAPAASVSSALPLASTGLPGDALPQKGALPTASSNTAAAAPAQEPLPIPATGPVQMAQLVSQAGQSEMRIGMNTSVFGSVEVRTVVHAGDVGLVIASEKGDLRTALANEMPAITSSLQQQNLRLNSVSYMQGFAFSNDFSGGGGSQQRSFIPNPAPSYASAAGAADVPAESAPLAAFVSGANSLSILA